MSDERLNKLFSKNLNYYLSLNGKSQADLYRYMGVSSAAVSNWCNGVSVPRMDKIQSICNWLQIAKSDLLEEKEKKDNHYKSLIELYYKGIMHWSEELGISNTQTLILNEHFSDLLGRYKRLIENFEIININWNESKDEYIDFYKKMNSDYSYEKIREMYIQQNLSGHIENIVNWINAFPNWIARMENKYNTTYDNLNTIEIAKTNNDNLSPLNELKAAHNDDTSPEQIELMNEDMEMLSRFSKSTNNSTDKNL